MKKLVPLLFMLLTGCVIAPTYPHIEKTKALHASTTDKYITTVLIDNFDDSATNAKAVAALQFFPSYTSEQIVNLVSRKISVAIQGYGDSKAVATLSRAFRDMKNPPSEAKVFYIGDPSYRNLLEKQAAAAGINFMFVPYLR